MFPGTVDEFDIERGCCMTIVGNVSAVLNQKGSQVWSVSPDATVFDAIELMAEKNVGALLVMERAKLVGIVSERDYTRKVALKGKASKQTLVSEIMYCPVIAATPEYTVEDCLRMMTEHRIRHLPVLEGESVAGIVSIGDLVNWTISAQTATISHLESYITGQSQAESRKVRTSHEVAVAFTRSPAALVERPDHQALSPPAIARGEYPWDAGGVFLKLRLDVCSGIACHSQLFEQWLFGPEKPHRQQNELNGTNLFSSGDFFWHKCALAGRDPMQFEQCARHGRDHSGRSRSLSAVVK